MAARDGQPTQSRNDVSTVSTSVIFAQSCMSPGKTMSRNHDILAKGKIPSLHALISQRRLRWLGHVTRMEDGRIPKDMLYSELCLGTRPTGRSALRFKDVSKWDMKACDIDTSSWETAAHNRTTWRKITHDGIKKNDKKYGHTWHRMSFLRPGVIKQHTNKPNHKWQEKRNKPPPHPPADLALKCNNCNKVCGSRIRLHSHRITLVLKNDSTKAQSPLSNMTDGCQQARSLAVHVPYSPHAILHTARSVCCSCAIQPTCYIVQENYRFTGIELQENFWHHSALLWCPQMNILKVLRNRMWASMVNLHKFKMAAEFQQSLIF